MSGEWIKYLNIGIPILVAVIGIILVIVLIREGIKASRESKHTVNGFVYLHPEHGGGYDLRLHDKKLIKPDLRPVWYREHWYAGELPLYFFYEDKATAPAQPETSTSFNCACGYEAVSKIALHAHTLCNPSRKLNGKPVTKEAWAKVHFKKEAPAVTQFILKPYDIDKETADPVITPFGVFDVNNWDCQKPLLIKRQSGLQKAIQLGAGVVMVIACLVGIIVLAGELNKKPDGSTQVNKPVTLFLEKTHGS